MRWPFRRRRPRPAETSTPARLREALRFGLAGDLAAAETALADQARFDSSSADIYLALANLYRARGEIGRAIQIHQNLLLQPGLEAEIHQQALLGLAQDFRAGGFLKRAAASFQELLQVDPRNLEALLALERIEAESGHHEEAIQIRRKIGRRDPDTARALARHFTALGQARLRDGDENEARKAWKRALGQDPGASPAYVVLGDLRLAEGKPKKAIGLWKRALDLEDADPPALYAKLFEAYAALGDFGGLERMLRERISQRTSDLDSAVWLARVLARQERVDEALSTLRDVVDRHPGFVAAHRELGRLLLQTGQEGEALKAYDALLNRL